jgi:hypothetical protein
VRALRERWRLTSASMHHSITCKKGIREKAGEVNRMKSCTTNDETSVECRVRQNMRTGNNAYSNRSQSEVEYPKMDEIKHRC